MKKLVKIILKSLFIFLFILCNQRVEASINKILQESPILNSATTSISIKQLSTGRTVYSYNEKKLLHPASVLKILTTPVIINQLKDDYWFITSMYIDGKNQLYIKLSADPSFSSSDLNTLIRTARPHLKNISKIYIDDTIIDLSEWGVGWMWDDNTSSCIQKFSPYNINKNLYKFLVEPNIENNTVKINKLDKESYVAVMNFLKVSDKDRKNNIIVKRFPWQAMDMIYFYGSVNTPEILTLAVNNPKSNFLSILNNQLANFNIDYYNNYEFKKVPQNAKRIASVSHNIEPLYFDILKNSDNFTTETLFKVASSKYIKGQGTFNNAKKMFYDYYKNLGLVLDNNIILADASGVSRNNLITADFITEALVKLSQEEDLKYFKYLAKGNQGTMIDRLFDIRENVYAKTGTLAGISSIAGYVIDKSGEKYAYAILTQNYISKNNDIKDFEDKIIRAIYEGNIN